MQKEGESSKRKGNTSDLEMKLNELEIEFQEYRKRSEKRLVSFRKELNINYLFQLINAKANKTDV